MAYINLLMICQVVDDDDPIQATTTRWIHVLANKKQIDKLFVLALRVGKYDLPNNVEVYKIGGGNRIATLFKLYTQVIKKLTRNEVDCFFIYQGGPYPLLLLPFKLLYKKNIYQWKAHPYVSLLMKYYAKYCDTLVFTSTKSAFPIELPNVKVIGQGVNINKFKISSENMSDDLVTVGRISPVKKLDKIIKILMQLRTKYGMTPRINIYGPVLQKDQKYKHYIDNLIKSYGLDEQVFIHGPVVQDMLPHIFNTHKIFINFSDTALDRSVVEALSCGLLVFSTNACVREIIPSGYKNILTIKYVNDEIGEATEKIYALLNLSKERRNKIGNALREEIIKNHSDEALFDKMLKEICRYE